MSATTTYSLTSDYHVKANPKREYTLKDFAAEAKLWTVERHGERWLAVRDGKTIHDCALTPDTACSDALDTIDSELNDMASERKAKRKLMREFEATRNAIFGAIAEREREFERRNK